MSEILKVTKDSIYGTGRRKRAIARVWIIPNGSGAINVNERNYEEYFPNSLIQNYIKVPFSMVSSPLSLFNIRATIKGGGLKGQAGALRLGIVRALLQYDETNREELKKNGLVTRDPRVKERKKYGKPKARKSFQFSKR
ncbi:MAG: 30S ribosomal protein S9 [Anaplasmataceae bacterium]|nr:30S ribosomal protein S9 [Candidatus Heimdallarchaeota archaeon]MDH5796764.1 30S ribosomal protein S9 [Anaplasmataceae bacterium]